MGETLMSVKIGADIPAYLMIYPEAGGKTHAINPKTKKTYCGRTYGEGWRPTDKIPSDSDQPTCKICQRHYDDPLKEEMHAIVKDLKNSIAEFLDTRCMLKDVDGLGRFVTMIKNFMHEELRKEKAIDDVNK